MLYENSDAFLAERNKRITLMGMSNVGKTRLASLLPRSKWFHYSVDYRLATHLKDQIVDSLKIEMMKNPYLAQLLKEDAMRVDINVAFSNLSVVSHYLGMLGNPSKGGLHETVFRARQAQHRKADIAAVGEIPQFITKAQQVYGYPHFVNDASGSLCEVVDPEDAADPVLAAVTDNTLLVYIQPDAAHEARLVEAARLNPKPLYYRPNFLDESLNEYIRETRLCDATNIDPCLFAQWVFPRLLAARRPRYEAIADHGYVVNAREVAGVGGEDDFLRLVGNAIDRKANMLDERGLFLSVHSESRRDSGFESCDIPRPSGAAAGS
jgi:hypothetical protein